MTNGTFGVPSVVAINRFSYDTAAELEAVRVTAAEYGCETVVASHWAEGGRGAEDLAHSVIDVVEGGQAQFAPLYPDDLPLWKKIRTIATHIYDAEDIMADQKVRDEIRRLEKLGYGHFPICMAKTQYSFSTDPELKGAPSGHQVPIREVRLMAGAEFVVVICGDILTMPGLPRVPSANSITVNLMDL